MSNPDAADPRLAPLYDLSDAWDQCKADMAGCYYNETCRNEPIKAHVLSKAWLRPLARRNEVYCFSRRERLFRGMYKPMNDVLALDEGALTSDASFREAFGAWRDARPELSSIDTTTTALFCCGRCDREFNPIDNWDTLNPQDPGDRCLNLMFLRAVIYQLYVETINRELRERRPDVAAHQAARGLPNVDSIVPLCRARRFLKLALRKGDSRRVRHLVRPIPGTPRLAGAFAGTVFPTETVHFTDGRLAEAERICPGVLGYTVVPHAGGHLAVLHVCNTLPHNFGGRWLDWKEGVLQAKVGTDAEVPSCVSDLLLGMGDKLCIAPEVWDRYPEGLQARVRDYTLSPVRWACRTGINLFG